MIIRPFPKKINCTVSHIDSVIVQEYAESIKRPGGYTQNIISPNDEFCLHLSYIDSFRFGDAYFFGHIVDAMGNTVWKSNGPIRESYISPWLNDSSGLYLDYCKDENRIVFVDVESGTQRDIRINEDNLLFLNLIPSSFNGVILTYTKYKEGSVEIYNYAHPVIKHNNEQYFILEDKIDGIGKKISILDTRYRNVILVVDHRKIRFFDIEKEEPILQWEIMDSDYLNDKTINTEKHFMEQTPSKFVEHVSTTVLTSPLDEFEYWQTVIYNSRENVYYLGRRKNISWKAGEQYSNDEWTCLKIEEIH